MSTDDRDIESSNPSKNFKVGDFDQRSGFFTPVWESKRRIRSEPPAPLAPPSSKSTSSRGNGQGAGGAEDASTQDEPSQEAAAQAPGAPAQEASSQAAATQESSGTSKRSQGAPRPRSSGGNQAKRSSAAKHTPVPPSTAEGAAAAAGLTPLPPAVAAVFDPSIDLSRDGASSAPIAPASAESRSGDFARGSSSASSLAEPLAASEAPARPSAAARALRDAGPNLPPTAFLDAEPEFRAPDPSAARDGAEDRLGRDVIARAQLAPDRSGPEERTDRSPAHHRSLRATSAAARVHDQLKAKLQAEAAEVDENRYDLAPDSQPILQAQEQEHDPYPQSLLRRLRRTIRLSAPVPDRIRSLLSRYDRG